MGWLDSQIGFGEEATPGTAVTPDRFFPFLSESMNVARNPIFSKGLRPGARYAGASIRGKREAAGDVQYEVQPNGFGIIPKYLIGGTPVTSTPDGATTARLHTTKVGGLDGAARTLQIGRANNQGGVTPFTFHGVKVASWQLSIEAGSDGLLTMQETLDAMDSDTSTTLAVATFAADNPLFSWSQANTVVTVGGASFNVAKYTLSQDNQLTADRYVLGSDVKLEQIEGGDLRSLTVALDLESFSGIDAGSAQDLIESGDEVEVVSTFIGPDIETGFPYMVKITIPRVVFGGDDPQIGGAGIIGQTANGQALYSDDTTTTIQFEVQNTDAAA